MADNIQFRDIQTGREMAWHGKTNVVENITRENCGILYPVSMQELHLASGTLLPDHRIMVAHDDGLPIGNPVRGRYEAITNTQIWDAVECALSGKGYTLESVGTIADRSKGFISIKLGDSFEAAGRETNSCLNVLWGHGGVMPVIAKTSFTVVVCENTFNLSLGQKGDFKFKIRHVGDVLASLDNMEAAIDGHFRTQNDFTRALDKMANQPMEQEQAKQFFAGFICEDGKIATRSRNQIEELDRLFRRGAGNSGENRADAFNAVTDLFTHGGSGSQKDPWSQFESSEAGSGATKKELAYALLLEKPTKIGSLVDVLDRGRKVLATAD